MKIPRSPDHRLSEANNQIAVLQGRLDEANNRAAVLQARLNAALEMITDIGGSLKFVPNAAEGILQEILAIGAPEGGAQ